jgi:hypothetical protein
MNTAHEKAGLRVGSRISVTNRFSSLYGRRGTVTELYDGDGTDKWPPAVGVRLDSKFNERQHQIVFRLTEVVKPA